MVVVDLELRMILVMLLLMVLMVQSELYGEREEHSHQLIQLMDMIIVSPLKFIMVMDLVVIKVLHRFITVVMVLCPLSV